MQCILDYIRILKLAYKYMSNYHFFYHNIYLIYSKLGSKLNAVR